MEAILRVATHSKEEASSSDLNPRDVRLSCLDVLLQDDLTIWARIKVIGVEVVGQLLRGIEELNAQALPTLVVLGNERTVKAARKLDQGVSIIAEQGAGRANAVATQSELLPQLAHLKLEGVRAVEHPTPPALQPGQDLAHQGHGLAVPTGV